MKRGKPLPYRSARRILEADQRAEVIEEVIARDGYLCHAIGLAPGQCSSPDPTRKELECHEIIPRSAWPAGWLVAGNCVMVCQHHHNWIDRNPDAAEAVGLHGKSWMRPDGHAGFMNRGEAL